MYSGSRNGFFYFLFERRQASVAWRLNSVLLATGAMCSPYRYTLPCSRCDRPECVSEFVISVLSIASEIRPTAAKEIVVVDVVAGPHLVCYCV